MGDDTEARLLPVSQLEICILSAYLEVILEARSNKLTKRLIQESDFEADFAVDTCVSPEEPRE